MALLLAALLSPAVMLLRKKGVRAGGAAAIAEIGMILVLAGIISLTGQQILRGFVSMADNAMQGYQRLIGWLKNLGYEFGADQLNQLLNQAENAVSNNPSSVLHGVSQVGSTAAEVATGTLLTLFTLVFFLMEGERIWLFVTRLFPKDARAAVNGAGRAGWKSWVPTCAFRFWWRLSTLSASVLVPQSWVFRWLSRWVYWSSSAPSFR